MTAKISFIPADEDNEQPPFSVAFHGFFFEEPVFL